MPPSGDRPTSADSAPPPSGSAHDVDPLAAVTDPDRLRALRRLRLLDTPPEAAFDRLAGMAQRLLDAPVVLLSLVDDDRQFFKACLGLPAPWDARRETPLSHSFCQYAVATGRELVITDAREDDVLSSNLAIPALGVVAYAGIPVRERDGEVIGTLCAIDGEPRTWSERDLDLLRDLAGAAEDLLEARLALLRSPERQAVLRQVVAAQEEERTRIAAEIHDDTIQTLVAVSMRLQLLAERSADDADGVLLDQLAGAATAATDRLRGLLIGLRPTGLDRGALGAAITEHATLVLGETAAVRVAVDDGVTLPSDVATGLFRIVQEALANARRHAGATEVVVALAAEQDGVRLRVHDDGSGLPASLPGGAGHLGLGTMRERAELLGGTLEVSDRSDGGVEVSVWVPLVRGERTR